MPRTPGRNRLSDWFRYLLAANAPKWANGNWPQNIPDYLWHFPMPIPDYSISTVNTWTSRVLWIHPACMSLQGVEILQEQINHTGNKAMCTGCKWEGRGIFLISKAPCCQQGLKNWSIGLIVMFLPTEIFSKRRKIYTWCWRETRVNELSQPLPLILFSKVTQKVCSRTDLTILLTVPWKHYVLVWWHQVDPLPFPFSKQTRFYTSNLP